MISPSKITFWSIHHSIASSCWSPHCGAETLKSAENIHVCVCVEGHSSQLLYSVINELGILLIGVHLCSRVLCTVYLFKQWTRWRVATTSYSGTESRAYGFCSLKQPVWNPLTHQGHLITAQMASEPVHERNTSKEFFSPFKSISMQPLWPNFS